METYRSGHNENDSKLCDEFLSKLTANPHQINAFPIVIFHVNPAVPMKF